MTHRTETQHTTQPASHPSALTRSSTLRVDTPCTDVTTANRARSIRRRRSSSEGKNDPVRIFGIFRSRSPAWVVSSLSRWPLRQVVRWSVCSPGAAPITSVASASMSSCRMRSRTTLIASTPSARRVTPAAASAQTGTRPSRAPPVELPVHQGDLRGGLPLLREHAQSTDARPEQAPARSGPPPGCTTSWDAISFRPAAARAGERGWIHALPTSPRVKGALQDWRMRPAHTGTLPAGTGRVPNTAEARPFRARVSTTPQMWFWITFGPEPLRVTTTANMTGRDPRPAPGPLASPDHRRNGQRRHHPRQPRLRPRRHDPCRRTAWSAEVGTGERTEGFGVPGGLRGQLRDRSPAEPVDGAFAVATMACSAATWPRKATRPSVVRRARTRRLMVRSTVT